MPLKNIIDNDSTEHEIIIKFVQQWNYAQTGLSLKDAIADALNDFSDDIIDPEALSQKNIIQIIINDIPLPLEEVHQFLSEEQNDMLISSARMLF
ncbi:hypothetical protein Metho_2704 (plasmid) [Methanomethylovorans hollandica DSM 15978]|uniref:Uncharacterized protein n=1 Tax=Methanomethylovorans hollandica (strain DSM 15978 / NBRC 107637 / DMS1) TaxID=867904 RepID=L0L362_METHD|nr:hypothetical protein [Methanomethylovorans hollandica]AGB50833.1 hypothetical protein Metho_2704 [Methanomethylovorans hollandica DSM 15978]